MTLMDRGTRFESEDAEFFHDGAVRDAKLSHDAEILGIPCAGSRSVVFYESGGLKFASLSKSIVIDDVPCDAGDIVFFYENGKLMNAALGRDHEFTGVVVPRGARVTLDEIGHLLEYSRALMADETIDGIPCSALFGVWHYASGKLSLALMSDAVQIDGNEYSRGSRLTFDEGGRVIDSVVCNVDFCQKYKREVCGVYQTPWQ